MNHEDKDTNQRESSQERTRAELGARSRRGAARTRRAIALRCILLISARRTVGTHGLPCGTDRARSARQAILTWSAIVARGTGAGTICRGRHGGAVETRRAQTSLIERRRAGHAKVSGLTRLAIGARSTVVASRAHTALIQRGRRSWAVFSRRTRSDRRLNLEDSKRRVDYKQHAKIGRERTCTAHI